MKYCIYSIFRVIWIVNFCLYLSCDQINSIKIVFFNLKLKLFYFIKQYFAWMQTTKDVYFHSSKSDLIFYMGDFNFLKVEIK